MYPPSAWGVSMRGYLTVHCHAACAIIEDCQVWPPAHWLHGSRGSTGRRLWRDCRVGCLPQPGAATESYCVAPPRRPVLPNRRSRAFSRGPGRIRAQLGEYLLHVVPVFVPVEILLVQDQPELNTWIGAGTLTLAVSQFATASSNRGWSSRSNTAQTWSFSS